MAAAGSSSSFLGPSVDFDFARPRLSPFAANDAAAGIRPGCHLTAGLTSQVVGLDIDVLSCGDGLKLRPIVTSAGVAAECKVPSCDARVILRFDEIRTSETFSAPIRPFLQNYSSCCI